MEIDRPCDASSRPTRRSLGLNSIPYKYRDSSVRSEQEDCRRMGVLALSCVVAILEPDGIGDAVDVRVVAREKCQPCSASARRYWSSTLCRFWAASAGPSRGSMLIVTTSNSRPTVHSVRETRDQRVEHEVTQHRAAVVDEVQYDGLANTRLNEYKDT